jgi:hypothetical protein
MYVRVCIWHDMCLYACAPCPCQRAAGLHLPVPAPRHLMIIPSLWHETSPVTSSVRWLTQQYLVARHVGCLHGNVYTTVLYVYTTMSCSTSKSNLVALGIDRNLFRCPTRDRSACNCKLPLFITLNKLAMYNPRFICCEY